MDYMTHGVSTTVSAQIGRCFCDYMDYMTHAWCLNGVCTEGQQSHGWNVDAVAVVDAYFCFA